MPKSSGEHDQKTKKKRGRLQVDVLSRYKAVEASFDGDDNGVHVYRLFKKQYNMDMNSN